MDENRYAPPKADVADVSIGGQGRLAPALWNPNAAANWSLLFSPVFGAFLHMKNWQALGEPGKASASKAWVIAGLAMFVVLALVSGFLPTQRGLDGVSRAIAFAFLVSWYFASARHQTAYVKARYGATYPRRGWSKPLLLAVVAFVCFIAAMVAIGIVLGALFGVA